MCWSQFISRGKYQRNAQQRETLSGPFRSVAPRSHQHQDARTGQEQGEQRDHDIYHATQVASDPWAIEPMWRDRQAWPVV